MCVSFCFGRLVRSRSVTVSKPQKSKGLWTGFQPEHIFYGLGSLLVPHPKPKFWDQNKGYRGRAGFTHREGVPNAWERTLIDQMLFFGSTKQVWESDSETKRWTLFLVFLLRNLRECGGAGGGLLGEEKIKLVLPNKAQTCCSLLSWSSHRVPSTNSGSKGSYLNS